MRGIWNQQKLNDSCQKKGEHFGNSDSVDHLYQNCHIGLNEVRLTSYVSYKAIEIQLLLGYIWLYIDIQLLFVGL
jgi:hypothetical protein